MGALTALVGFLRRDAWCLRDSLARGSLLMLMTVQWGEPSEENVSEAAPRRLVGSSCREGPGTGLGERVMQKVVTREGIWIG